MGKERISAKKDNDLDLCQLWHIYTWLFILGSMGTDKYIVWSNFILMFFLVVVSAGFKYYAI